MNESVLYGLVPGPAAPASYHGCAAHPSFGDPGAELAAAAAGRGCVDHSMFGRIEVSGADRVDLLHRLSTNALAGLRGGDAAATVFVTDKGRIVDRVLVCALEKTLLILTSPRTEAFLAAWIGKYTITEDITLSIVTGGTAMVSFTGPEALSAFCAGEGCALPAAPGVTRSGPYTVAREPDGKVGHVITGAVDAPALARSVAALAPGARWIGFRAWEAYRIGRGIAGSPGELNGEHNPLECGLRDAVSFTKGCYIGQEVIARLDTYGKERHALAALAFTRMPGGTLPSPLTRDGSPAGTLTSVSDVAQGGAFPALAVVRTDAAPPGATLHAGDAEGTVTGYF